jgi:hypothetical protein
MSISASGSDRGFTQPNFALLEACAKVTRPKITRFRKTKTRCETEDCLCKTKTRCETCRFTNENDLCECFSTR